MTPSELLTALRSEDGLTVNQDEDTLDVEPKWPYCKGYITPGNVGLRTVIIVNNTVAIAGEGEAVSYTFNGKRTAALRITTGPIQPASTEYPYNTPRRPQ